MDKTLLLLTCVIGATLAGCQGADQPGSIVEVSYDSDADVGATRGEIRGLVMDNERQPIGGALVLLVGIEKSATSGQDGAFRFLNVPAGAVSVEASKPGYLKAAREVDVNVGERIEVQFILDPVPKEEPYVEVFPHTSLIHYGSGSINGWIDDELPTGAPPGCDACEWNETTNRPPDFLVAEVFGQHSISNPAAPCDSEWFFMWENSTDGRQLQVGDECMPIKWVMDDSVIQEATTFAMRLNCEVQWFCWEETRETYLSFFHHGKPAEGYTAVPE